MKFSFKANDYEVYTTLTLIDGRSGLSELQANFEEYRTQLSSSSIESIEVYSDIVSPLLRAEILYTDDQLENMINTHGNIDLYCDMRIRLTGTAVTADVSPEYDEQFSHLFYIDGVEIIDRDSDAIKYRIKMISASIDTFTGNAPFSSITTKTPNGQTATDIIKSLFSDKLSITSSDISTSELIEYITPCNTDLLSSMIHVLRKNVSSPNSDLLLVPYDHMTKSYDLWVKSKWINEYNTIENDTVTKYQNILKMNIDSIDGYNVLTNEIGQFATQDIKSNTDVKKAITKTIHHDFDYDNNTFTNEEYTKQIIVNSLGQTVLNNGYKNRIDSQIDNINNTENTKGYEIGDWSDVNGYFARMMTCLTENATLIVNTGGNIYRKPSLDFYITVDHSSQDYSSLLNFSGRWLAVKVRHIFKPKEESYTNTIMLSRLDIQNDAREVRETV